MLGFTFKGNIEETQTEILNNNILGKYTIHSKFTAILNKGIYF
jgi:hypothetical protein